MSVIASLQAFFKFIFIYAILIKVVKFYPATLKQSKASVNLLLLSRYCKGSVITVMFIFEVLTLKQLKCYCAVASICHHLKLAYVPGCSHIFLPSVNTCFMNACIVRQK